MYCQNMQKGQWLLNELQQESTLNFVSVETVDCVYYYSILYIVYGK